MKELAIFWMVICFFKKLRTMVYDFKKKLHLGIDPKNCTDNVGVCSEFSIANTG
jgi:hypothetical protein